MYANRQIQPMLIHIIHALFRIGTVPKRKTVAYAQNGAPCVLCFHMHNIIIAFFGCIRGSRIYTRLEKTACFCLTSTFHSSNFIVLAKGDSTEGRAVSQTVTALLKDQIRNTSTFLCKSLSSSLPGSATHETKTTMILLWVVFSPLNFQQACDWAAKKKKKKKCILVLIRTI